MVPPLAAVENIGQYENHEPAFCENDKLCLKAKTAVKFSH